MNNSGNFRTNRIRLITFAAVAVFHITLLFFVVFNVETKISPAEPVAGVMKLFDLREQSPPPEEPPEDPITNTQEIIAETMIETDEVPPPFIAAARAPAERYGEVDYLPAHMLTVIPVLPRDEISRAMVYPPIALRSGIEGSVILDLFIDRHGNILEIRVLREEPTGRGFAEAAINALKGIKAKPGELNGVAFGAQYRHPIRFTLK